MRSESQLAGFVWDALEFARNAQIAIVVGVATLEAFVNPRIVYRAATEQVPELIPVLEALLTELAPPES